MKIHWVNLVTMYLTQAVVGLAFANLFGWQLGNASIVSGVLVGFCFGISNIPIITKIKK